MATPGYAQHLKRIANTVVIKTIIISTNLAGYSFLKHVVHGHDQLHGNLSGRRNMPFLIACRGRKGNRCRFIGLTRVMR